ncbi:MAG: ATP-binding cassette domain-containing protein [Deltaproteobacteria bacterium]|nr:ATP-binding cassette domain-containing protein [Deltaproteobacteria bacterium]
MLHDISLHVDSGETVCVVGSNGAGKSTLLRAIMGAQRVFEGRVVFQGEEMQRLQNRSGGEQRHHMCRKRRCSFNPSQWRKT